MFPESLLLPLLFLALSGNLLEEVLFRGCLQGYFEERSGPLRALTHGLAIFLISVGLV